MEIVKKFCDWLSTKQANVVFAALFALFFILDLSDKYYYMAALDAVVVVLNVISFKRKGK